jgi:hypothetical protein
MVFKYSVGDKVRVIPKYETFKIYKMESSFHRGWVMLDCMGEFCGKVVTIDAIDECDKCYHIKEMNEKLRWTDEMFEGLVEDKKVFTKNDLKTGMFGVMDNGFKFVVVDDRFIYSNGEWDKVSSLNDNLEMYSKKIMTVYDRTAVCSFNTLAYAITSNLFNPVYDRERDTKPLYNGKVVCIDLNNQNFDDYTVGKIYQFKDGCLITDDGFRMENKAHPIRTFEDWEKFSHSKWLEIKE